MKNPMRGVAALALSISSAAMVGCVMMQPIGDITLTDQRHSERYQNTSPKSEETVTVTAFVTGWVKAPANILIDQSDPDTPKELRQRQWVPSIAFAIRHPDHGVAILDTGLRSSACEYGLRPIYWVPCRNEPGGDLVSQLKVSGIEPEHVRFIIPSHFHGDHISGLSALLTYADATVLATDASMKDVRSSMRFIKGIPTSMISSDMRVQIIDGGFTKDQLGIEVFDVFGDGTLKLFRTRGHTAGHISAIARGIEREIVFSFDASHLKANFDLQIPSGSVSSKAAAAQSLETIRSLVSSLDHSLLIFGHEPSQWKCVGAKIRIDQNFDFCS